MNVLLRPQTPVRHGFTGADVLRMQDAGILLDSGRFELIDGEIIDMPSEGDAHIELKGALNRYLVFNVGADVTVMPDATLRLTDTDWPEPDFYIYPRQVRASALRGADTLLVIEMSDSSLRHDLTVKADLYRRCGVREYWVVDLNGERLYVHRADGAWPAPAVPLTTSVQPALIPGLSVTIAELLAG